MPKFGWKCFIGSFLFSLAAVFATTRVYLMLSQTPEEENPAEFANLESRNIELFAQKEDDIAHAVAIKSAAGDFNFEDSKEPAAEHQTSAEENNAEIQTASAENSSDLPELLPEPEDNGSILYEPEDSSAAETNTAEDATISVSPDYNDISEETAAATETAYSDSDELQIADASEAQPFMIPLQHNYSVADGSVTVSHETANNQIALASKNVKVDNLGIEDRPAETSLADAIVEDSPWDIATVANEHITKNSFEKHNAERKNETAALDPQTSEIPAEEIKLAGKRPDNLLIKIPDEIKNDDNLVPDLAYSEENKKLVKKLHLDKPLKDSKKDTKESVTVNEKTDISATTPVPDSGKKNKKTTSLTDSIAAWFSSDSSKTAETPEESDEENSAEESADGKTSAFDRLLGLGKNAKKGNIAPSELKLAFQPNRAEISGQTLDWLHAFSANAMAYEDVFIEIRINAAVSQELQQKRLKLLYSILLNNGVDFNKINIIFTDREPNSFIIRNVRYASEESAAKARQEAYNPWR